MGAGREGGHIRRAQAAVPSRGEREASPEGRMCPTASVHVLTETGQKPAAVGSGRADGCRLSISRTADTALRA